MPSSLAVAPFILVATETLTLCAMIDKSDVVIFYAEEREDSGAYKAYKYARTKKTPNIVNVFDNIPN